MQQSAVVLTHQQFDRPPVKNPASRGRLPKGVVKMHRASKDADVSPPGEPLDPLVAMGRLLDMVQCSLDVARNRLAEYERCHRRTG